MPAPHRRNKGESLAQHVGAHAASRLVANDRDNLVASLKRKDAKWEEAAARLEQQPSTLAERAEQARVEYERGKQLARFSTDVREGRARPPVAVTAPVPQPRYFLGQCVSCSREMWVHNSRPRVPLCERCRR